MLLFPPAVLSAETSIVVLNPTAVHLAHWRLGVIVHDGPLPNKLGQSSAAAYQFIVAYAAVDDRLTLRRIHRVAYLNCAGAPGFIDGIQPDDSDDLCTPESFIAGEPLTVQPTKYGQHDRGGPLTRVKAEWASRLTEFKKRWDSYRQRLGLPLLNSSKEIWGRDYCSPTF